MAGMEVGGQSKAQILVSILTQEELLDIALKNTKTEVGLEVKDVDASSVDPAAEGSIKEKIAEGEKPYYFTMDMFLTKDGVRADSITEWNKPLVFEMVLPGQIRQPGRTFRLAHSHKDRVSGAMGTTIHSNESGDPDRFKFSTNKMSTLAFLYSDTAAVTPTYTPSYTSGTTATTSYSSSSSSSSGGGGGSSSEGLAGGKSSSKAYYAKLSKNTVEYLMPKLKKNAKKAVVPAKVRSGKKTYKVTSISGYAFVGNDNLRSIRIGKNVRRISPYAFYGCGKLKTLNVNSRFLTAKKVKGCLKGSVVNKVSVMKRAVPKLKLYKKIFAKKNTGASKNVSVRKKK